jgi:sugar phosphate permease
MLIGMVASTVALLTLGQTDVIVFAICIGLVGFTLYGPDALLTGAGAMDIGSKDGAVRAAGIISGLGSAGSVVQELMIGRSYSTSGGAIAPILTMLFGSALFAAACVAVILWRNRQGLSDV